MHPWGADSGFAAERVWRGLAQRGITAYVPPPPSMLPKAGEPKTDAQREALAARARCKSERGVWAHKQRMGDAEGVIGELKNRHGLDRVRSRGTPLFHLQLLLSCTAINCKRLAEHLPEAANGVAGAPPAASDLRAEAAGACPADRDAQPPPGETDRALIASPSTWSYSFCLNRAPRDLPKPLFGQALSGLARKFAHVSGGEGGGLGGVGFG